MYNHRRPVSWYISSPRIFIQLDSTVYSIPPEFPRIFFIIPAGYFTGRFFMHKGTKSRRMRMGRTLFHLMRTSE